MIPYLTILAAFGFLSHKSRFRWPPSKMANIPPEIFKDGHENPKEGHHYPKVVKN